MVGYSAVRRIGVCALAALLAGCGPKRASSPLEDTGVPHFEMSSRAFAAGATIPSECTCDGSNRSPDLHWGEPPPGTRSFALLVIDPDAPGGDFTHWVLFDIPGAARDLAPSAAGTAGKNDFGKTGYGGPCPPRGHGPHRYVFTLYALDQERLGLQPGARRAEVERAARGHVLGSAQLTGRYERS